MAGPKRLGKLRLAPLRREAAAAVAPERQDVLSPELRERLVAYFSPKLQGILRSESRFLVLAMGRRTGKSTLMLVRWLLSTPAGETSLYLAPTARKAGEIMRPKVEELCRSFPELAGRLTESPDGVRYEPTGATLRFGGLSSLADVEKLRGGRHPIAFFDEIGALHLERFELAVDAVAPALFDFAGQPGCGLVLAGTASRAWGSYVHWLFEQCAATEHHSTNRTQPERWHSTLRDNPRFEHTAEKVIDEELGRKGLTRQSAWYSREIEARFVLSAEDSCCPASAQAVVCQDSYAPDFVGLSPSFRGWSAAVGLAAQGDRLVVVSTEQRRQQSPPDLVEWLRVRFPAAQWATDGSEVALPKVFETSYGQLLQNARCAFGPAFLSLLAHTDGLIRSGKLVFHAGARPLLEELQALSFADTHDRPHPGQASRQVLALLAAVSLSSEGAVVAEASRPDFSLAARWAQAERTLKGR